MIDILAETARHYKDNFRGQKIGVLATDGTLKSKLIQSALPTRKLVVPGPQIQKKVMGAIYGECGVKSGDLSTSKFGLLQAVNHLIRNGAEVVLAGCTEVSIVLDQTDLDVPLVDPIEILCQRCLEILMGLDS